MRSFVTAASLCLLVTLGLALVPVSATAAPEAATVIARLYYVGGPIEDRTFRFDYTITNNSLEPEIAGFVVFFNSDALDRATFVSETSPMYWDDVFVTPKAPDGSWNVEWNEIYGMNRILPGNSLNGFSVTFQWNDPFNYPGPQPFEVWNGEAYDGVTEVIPSGPTATESVSWGRIKGLFR